MSTEQTDQRCPDAHVNDAFRSTGPMTMLHERHSKLEISSSPPLKTCRVSQQFSLGEISERYDLEQYAYLLVEDVQSSRLIGVVSSEDILKRISAPHSAEALRWQNLPVEAVLQVRFSENPTQSLENTAEANQIDSISCLSITGADGLEALMTHDNLFVSWHSVKKTLNQAFIDPVTGLPNRAVFEQRLLDEYHRALRYGHSLSVILIDVDNFKEINDVFGHITGDTVLQDVAGCVREQLRSYDIVTRFGGDEFAVICSGCRPGEIAIPISRLYEGIKDIVATTDESFPRMTISVGGAVEHEIKSLSCAKDLVERADDCLYRAKREGRGCAFTIECDGTPSRVRLPTGHSRQDPILPQEFSPAQA